MASNDDTRVDALWVAGFTAQAPDGTQLIPGETVLKVGYDEAAASDHWQIVGQLPSGPTKDQLLARANDELGLKLAKSTSKADVEQAIADELHRRDRLAAAREAGAELPDDATIDQIEEALSAEGGDA